MSLTPQQAKELAEQLLDGPGTAPGAADAPPAPESIGSYRILRCVASGGMGTVYEAQQQHPHRTVALKVMKRGIASHSALGRFEYEAEILGRLRHPGIAQIYEAGTHDDGSGTVPFFAMEYVPNARNIIEYASAEDLSARERLGLFATVCDAVHHGHQKGVIHRDLKPGNILVDETGEPKVIDFGVARATDADMAVTTIQTGVGELLGTLQYMSPEQCEAKPEELDTRTDVYSLGVVLYELLCDQPPYDLSDTSLPKATRIIQEQEPSRPSMTKKVLRGDVEAITLRALEKAPDQRYQSAAHLAQDIRRHLSGEPIDTRARRPWMRVSRWVGRHPIVTTTLACVAIAGISTILTMGSIWWLNRRPHQIQVTADKREASLMSVAGRILHTWRSAGAGKITLAKLVARPPELGGGRIALIGTDADTHISQDGSLCAFVLSNLDDPIWTVWITNDDIRESPLPAGFTESQFQVTCAETIDVFPDRPGEEIVTIHKDGAYSPVALRVYNLSGEVLYQIWHNGPLNPVYWMGAERRLVACGLSHEAPWAQEYFQDAGRYPIVVFALDPEVGHIGRRWTGACQGADTDTLAWYKCVTPPAMSAVLGGAFVKRPHTDEDASRFLRFGVQVRDERDATVSWLMTADGALVPGSEVPTDRYTLFQKRGRAPAPELVKLENLLPAVAGTE